MQVCSGRRGGGCVVGGVGCVVVGGGGGVVVVVVVRMKRSVALNGGRPFARQRGNRAQDIGHM